MTHDDAVRHLDDFVDGELDRSLHTAVEQHVQACAACAAEVAAIRGLVQRARALPESVELRRDLWRDIEASIRRGGAAASSPAAAERAAAGGRRAAPRRWFGWPQLPAWRWASAVGAAAVVVTLTIAAWQMWRSGHVQPGPGRTGYGNGNGNDLVLDTVPKSSTPAAGVEGLLSALELECMGAGKSLVASMSRRMDEDNVALTASITAGLDAVDLAIAETRAALVADPQDADLLRLLTARYEQKLALLHGAMRLIEEA